MPHTAVYGIYANRQDTEVAIDSMRTAGFRPEDISVLFPDNEGTKISGTRNIPKRPRELPRVQQSPVSPEEQLGGWPALARLQFQVSGRSSPPARLWERSPDWGPEVSSAEWLAPWWASEFRSTRQSATRAGSATAASCFRFIVKAT